MWVILYKLLRSYAMCAHPKKAMKVRYKEHELIWGGFSDFILTDNDSEKIEVFFFKFSLMSTWWHYRGSNPSAVAGVPKKWENENHFESLHAIFHGQEYSTLSLGVFKPVENNIKFTARAVYKLDDPWRENMLLEYFIFIFWLESKKFNRNKMVTKIAPECRRLVKQGR